MKHDIHINLQTNILALDCIRYDAIGRFERMQSDFRDVLTAIGAPRSLLPAVNEVTNASPQLPCAAVYNRELVDVVFDMYRADFEAFGYARDSWMFDGE